MPPDFQLQIVGEQVEEIPQEDSLTARLSCSSCGAPIEGCLGVDWFVYVRERICGGCWGWLRSVLEA